MYPDPLPPRRFASGESPQFRRSKPSIVLALLGLAWAVAFAVMFLLVHNMGAIVGGNAPDSWTGLLWGIFGPQVVMGVSVLCGGSHMSRPARLAFLIATLGSFCLGVVMAANEPHETTVLILITIVSTIIALIPQSLSWAKQ